MTLALGLGGCSTAHDPLNEYEQLHPATALDTPEAVRAQFPAADVARGRYLVGLLGCGGCHTNGALVGAPVPGQLLAGSDTGLAWSNPLAERNPGVVYPANLTPDVDTGLGGWSVAEIARMIQTGVDRHSRQSLTVMPWPNFANLAYEDAAAVAVYLLSLPPVHHRVPANVDPGRQAGAPFVHFGIYRGKR